MKILWITNTLFPEAKGLLTGKNDYKGKGEGWLLGSANELVKRDDLKLYVASVSTDAKELIKLEGEKIIFYILPFVKDDATYDKRYEDCWKIIYNEAQPDVVHLHGTEYPHGLAYLKACGNKNVVASIQGMTSVIAKFYLADLNRQEVKKNRSFHDYLKGDGLLQQEKSMIVRGEIEKEIIRNLRYIIGRTSWDKANSWVINPEIKYFFCNETLRQEFYSGEWHYYACRQHTLFLPQANYPLKGFHQILKALPIILQHYPDMKVRVAGDAGGYAVSFKDKLRERSYNKIVRGYIEKYSLRNVIEFTGPLSAEEMKQEYLDANLFICPSSIENSPNALCEAQMLGVPCLASYAGGIPDLIPNSDCGEMFRYEETGLLAYKVCQCLEKSREFDNHIMRETARNRHNREINLSTTMRIYKEIIENETE